MIAAELMTENPRTVRPTDPVSQALDALQSMEVRHLPVVNEQNELVGMLSDRDLGPLMRTFTEGADAERLIVPLSSRRVADFMSADVVSVDTDAALREVIETMLEQRIGALPVLDGEGNVAGIISYTDVLRATLSQLEPQREAPRKKPTAPASAGPRSGRAQHAPRSR
jgi:CBS domain-containing protein